MVLVNLGGPKHHRFMARSCSRRIGFVIFPRVTALDFIGPMEAFVAADGKGRRGGYELVVIGLDRSPVRAESGVEFNAACGLDSAPPLDTVLIPGGGGLREPRVISAVSRWLLKRAARTRRIASVCTGIYGLAATGLLDGRRVATHWAFAPDVARRFPKLHVDADALFVKDGKFYTSAGVTAGIDLALALIEEDRGPTAALAAARELVVYLKRSGDQAQYSDPLRFQARSGDRFADLAAWIAVNLRQPLSVEQLAGRMGLGARHFSRRFKMAFNMTPAEFVERRRLEEACGRLLQPRANVDTVAASVGFRSAEVFRRAFQRRFGVAPGHYRARFAASRPRQGRSPALDA